MLSCLTVAKKHVHVYCFHGKHFTCWDLRDMLETHNFVQKDSKQTLHKVTINYINDQEDSPYFLFNHCNYLDHKQFMKIIH